MVVGVDLGWKWDTTAIVPIRRIIRGDNSTGDRIEVHPPAILTPPQDGRSLDANDVFGACEAMAERWPGLTFALDPEAGGEQLAQRLDAELNATVMTHSQKAGPMCDASEQLATAIREGSIRHPNNAELNRHVLAAAARFYGVGWRFVKPKNKNLPIDGAVALAMAVRVLNSNVAAPQEPDSGLRGPGSRIVFAGMR